MTADVLYPVTEVARMWRCSAEHVYEQIRRGRLRTVNVAHSRAKTRVPASAIAAYLQSRTEPPAGPQTPPNPTKPRARRTHPDPMPVPVPTPDPQARPKRVAS